jgi:hypothetical protein
MGVKLGLSLAMEEREMGEGGFRTTCQGDYLDFE